METQPFEENKFITAPIIGEGAEENEDAILSLPSIFTEDRKSFPYMISPENLLKPIKQYVRLSSRGSKSNDFLTTSKYERQMAKRIYNYNRTYKEKGKKFEYTEEGTHTDMATGILGIPFDKEDDFLTCYGELITFGATAWFVERPTKIMRMFMDFDFNQKTALSFQDIEILGYIVQLEIKKFFPSCLDNEALDLIVSTTNSKPCILDKESGLKGIKTGVHMHWGFYADIERAMNIRESLKAACTKNAGKRSFPLNSWEEVLDSCIYSSNGKDGSGLRMMGSEKAKRCKTCEKRKRGSDEKMCEDCKDERGINEGRAYHALYVMDIHGNRKLEKEKNYKLDFVKLVKDTKIRTDFTEIPQEPKFELFEGAPIFKNEKEEKSIKKIILDSNGKKKRTPQKDKDLRGINIEIKNFDREWDAIEDYITKHSLPKYKNVYVSDITTDTNRKSYFVHVKGEFCRYCHNISREHESNRIYFIITVDGMVQRCHDTSEKTPEMKFGPCHDYKSAVISLTNQVANVLFKRNELLIDGKKSNASGIPDTDGIIDKKFKMLVIMGNELCKSLYGVNWITENENGELLLAKENNVKRPKKDILFSMEDTVSNNYSLNVARIDGLGSKSSEILQKLGFLEKEPQRKMSLGEEEEEEQTIGEIESLAFSTLFNIVQICCMMSKEDISKIGSDFMYFY
jgi:hypothetical protein